MFRNPKKICNFSLNYDKLVIVIIIIFICTLSTNIHPAKAGLYNLNRIFYEFPKINFIAGKWNNWLILILEGLCLLEMTVIQIEYVGFENGHFFK